MAAELVTIDGQTYKKRSPLVVLGLSVITLGIYALYWFYDVNDEIRRFERDETISPGRSLLAVALGWLLIVPPFIAVYNTSLHVVKMEQRLGIPQQLSPALNLIFLLIVGIVVPVYTQEHLNRVWDSASGRGGVPPATPGTLPPPPPS
jgi:hypothetical protein